MVDQGEQQGVYGGGEGVHRLKRKDTRRDGSEVHAQTGVVHWD